MRLNDRAGETRYIDPAREQERTADYGYARSVGITHGVIVVDN